MKKYLLGVLLIMAVIFVSGCITDSDNSGTNETDIPKTIAKNGILIKYPGSWVVANSSANNSILVIADPNSKDPGSGFSNVNIERQDLPSSLTSYFNQTYSKLFSNSEYVPIAQGNVSIGNYSALECIYTQNDEGLVKQHRTLWIENNNQVYVILCTAPQGNFNRQSKNFDYILSNFEIT